MKELKCLLNISAVLTAKTIDKIRAKSMELLICLQKCSNMKYSGACASKRIVLFKEAKKLPLVVLSEKDSSNQILSLADK
jgi:hypothetical protein